MKPIALQLVTVCLENGQQGVFVGVPLVGEQIPDEEGQIEKRFIQADFLNKWSIGFKDTHYLPADFHISGPSNMDKNSIWAQFPGS